MKKMKYSVCLSCLILILFTSCGVLPTPVSSIDQINTSVAQTVAAAQVPQPTLPSPVSTQEIFESPTESPQVPTLTPIPLATVVPPTATATTDTCYRADWLQDVTVPDGSVMPPNTKFVNTWRIQNVGSCTWTTTYALIYSGGHTSGAPATTPLSANVTPGGMLDVSVEITTPATDGDYTWEFMLRSDTGRVFGFGSSYNYPITAEIKVSAAAEPGGEETMRYDLASAYCTASWQSIFGPLSCPGTTSDNSGFVVRDDNAKLQDNKKYDGAALYTHPAWIDDGVIRGDYPAILMQDDYHFRATLGCGYGGGACDVRYALGYKVDGGAWVEIGSWIVKYSDDPMDIDVDFSFLEGKNVSLGLVVAAHGSSAQDWAHWSRPRVVLVDMD